MYYDIPVSFSQHLCSTTVCRSLPAYGLPLRDFVPNTVRNRNRQGFLAHFPA